LQAVVIVGIYRLWIKQGEVSLLGASLQSANTVYEVAVPVIHAIPSITAISDLAEVIIYSKDTGLRYLGDVARHFADIWDPTFISITTKSFHVVRLYAKGPFMFKHLLSSTARLPL
jgi:hypothetical protein